MIEIMQRPKVSIVLSSYNGGEGLILATNSIVEQDYKDWELILLDDGSTDGSIEKIRKISDSRIRIISDGMNKGLASRLNEGIELSCGEYVARMDADDICLPARLKLQVDYLDNNKNVDLVGSQIVAFYPGVFVSESKGPELHAHICARPWNGIRIAHPTWMARRDWYRSLGYHIPEYVRAEDQELLLRGMASSTYAVIPEVLLAYRQGSFNYEKTKVARQSLLSAQIKYFKKNKEYVNLTLSVLAYVLKSSVDMLAAMPGMRMVFFKRMGVKVSEDVRRNLIHITGG
jgi:glycosyltransferase involved in cell wall biosynthesis